MAQRGEIDDQPIITSAEACQTVSTAAHCGYDMGSSDSSQTSLNVDDVFAASQ
jgi:hypothetical protein